MRLCRIIQVIQDIKCALAEKILYLIDKSLLEVEMLLPKHGKSKTYTFKSSKINAHYYAMKLF